MGQDKLRKGTVQTKQKEKRVFEIRISKIPVRQKRQVTEECTHVIPTNTKGKNRQNQTNMFSWKEKSKAND